MELKKPTPIVCQRCNTTYSDIVVYLRHTIVMNCKEGMVLTPIEKEALKELQAEWKAIPWWCH